MLIEDRFYTPADIETIRLNREALNLDPDVISDDGAVNDNKVFLHIELDNIPMGFILLADKSIDVNCLFDGPILEITIAIHREYASDGNGLRALEELDNWVLERYGRVRLEAVIQANNPHPQRIRNLLTRANFRESRDFCQECSRSCVMKNSLPEWHKVLSNC